MGFQISWDMSLSGGGSFEEMLNKQFNHHPITMKSRRKSAEFVVECWRVLPEELLGVTCNGAEVCSFPHLMETQDLHSPLSLSSTSSSSPSSASDLPLVSIEAERWKVGQKTTQQLLSVIQPNVDSEKRRKDLIKYIQEVIGDSFGVKVFPFGSVPLKTYLPHGDVDLTVVSHYDASQGLAAGICNLLKDEEKNNASIRVSNVLYVPAQVEVVKCTVGNIAVDISFNQTAGLSALCFLEQVDQYIGKDHLFKRSVILIKAWCYYESRLLGGFYGLISSYALETLVLHKFLTYYSTFDWGAYCVSINGLVLISSLPKIKVHAPDGSDEALLADVFLRSSREAFSFYTGFTGIEKSKFPVKFLNILDPLRDDNNLGRCVCKGNFYRIRTALSYGTERLNEVLTSQPEKIMERLEKFFINTLERNGRGRRADVCVSVPLYGAEISEISLTDGTSDDLLTGIQYDTWFDNYGIIYQPHLGWVHMAQNAHYDQNRYHSGDESSITLVDGATSLQLTNAASVHGKGKSRGTGTYIPRLEHLLQRYRGLEEEVKRADTQTFTHREATTTDKDGNSCCVFNYSGEEFPLLPGSKPIPTKVSQSGYLKDEIKESLASLDGLMFGSLKCSLESLTLSKLDKQSISDVSVNLASSNDPAVPKDDDGKLSNSEEKMYIQHLLIRKLGLIWFNSRENRQPLELTDDDEFPPLMQLAKSEVRFNKKEFPSLSASLRSEKMNKCRKKFKEMPKKASWAEAK